MKPKPYDESHPSTKEAGGAMGSYTQAESSALFVTPSQRIEFYVEKLKEFGQELPVFIEPPESPCQPLAKKYPLTLLEMHSKARFHSALTHVDWLRELDPEPLVKMNPVDAEKRGIQDGDLVTVTNDRGRAKLKARIHEGIRPGVVTMGEGWHPKHYAEGCHQELTNTDINPAQEAVFGTIGQMQGILVEIKKTEEG
jgi:molybdopterin-containing oxidoreductase family molybdopterin binding subunit